MKKIDHLALDGRLIRLFLTVHDCLSITRTAELLNTTQSNISHGLDRLRLILNDPLFVRAGRGMDATAEANRLVPQMRKLLRDMEILVEPVTYSPAEDSEWFTVAANDFECEVIVRPFFQRIRAEAPHIKLRVLQLGSPSDVIEMLRKGDIDLAISPAVISNADDIRQQSLFRDSYVCFYDSKSTSAPETLDQYITAAHIQIGFGKNKNSTIDDILQAAGHNRTINLEVQSMYSLPNYLLRSNLIVTLPSLLSHSILKPLDYCNCPLEMPAMQFLQYWHERNNRSLRQKWFRDQLKAVAQNI